jgi:ribokinase
MDFIGCGALNLDRLYKVPRITTGDEEIHILDMKEEPGGSAANTIYALGKLGIDCGFFGAIGDDPEGQNVVLSLKQVGVDTSKITVKNGERTGMVIGIVDQKGERSLYISPGANNLLSQHDMDIDYIRGTKYLHVSSFVQNEQLDVQKQLVGGLDENTKFSFSPGSLYAKMGFDAISPLIKRTHVLFLNDEEAKILTGLGSYQEASDFLLNSGCAIVVVTLDARGCFINDGENPLHVEAMKTDVVDTTGAGDSFCAGFLYGLVKDKNLHDCGVMGNFLASKCISKIGARIGLLGKAEFEQGMDKFL